MDDIDDDDDNVEDDDHYSGTEGDTWGRRGNNKSLSLGQMLHKFHLSQVQVTQAMTLATLLTSASLL